MSQALRNPFVWAFVLGCALVTLMRPMLRYEPGPPSVIGRLPPFSLIAQDERPFGSDDLRGRVYVASFFYTRCRSICDSAMRSMAALQERYRAAGLDVGLVTISVDPAFDGPERLREAESRYGVDPSRWRLLTGPPAEVRNVAENGFEVAMGEPIAAGDGAVDIAHSGKLVLVDARGGVRGFYGADEMGVDEVFHRSLSVLGEAASRERSS
ncbi:MAG: SCO family protein [Candidatus Binatia bacterium]